MIRASVSGQLNCAYKIDSLSLSYEKAMKYLGHGLSELQYVSLAKLIIGKKLMADSLLDSAYAAFSFTADTSKAEIGAEANYYMAEINFNKDSIKMAEDQVFKLISWYINKYYDRE